MWSLFPGVIHFPPTVRSRNRQARDLALGTHLWWGKQLLTLPHLFLSSWLWGCCSAWARAGQGLVLRVWKVVAKEGTWREPGDRAGGGAVT